MSEAETSREDPEDSTQQTIDTLLQWADMRDKYDRYGGKKQGTELLRRAARLLSDGLK